MASTLRVLVYFALFCPLALLGPSGYAGDLPQTQRVAEGAVVLGADANDASAAQDEYPQRRVVIANAFDLGTTPVTRGQFRAFVQATGHAADGGCWTLTEEGWALDLSATWQAPGFAQTDQHPVVCVSHPDARAYAAWLSQVTGRRYRLPSEAEWTRAAHNNGFWSAPQTLCHYGNVNDLTAKNATAKAAEPCDDGYAFTSPVAHYAASAFGVYDIVGNVWEWMADCHGGGYAALPADGTAQRSALCNAYALRGHSWTDAPGPVRLQTRYALPADARQAIVGFRIAADIPQ